MIMAGLFLIGLIPLALLLFANVIFTAAYVGALFIRGFVAFAALGLLMWTLTMAVAYSLALVVAFFVIAFSAVFVAHARKASKNRKTPDTYFG
jgi:hypothetical protein